MQEHGGHGHEQEDTVTYNRVVIREVRPAGRRSRPCAADAAPVAPVNSVLMHFRVFVTSV
jgi:hypothetical protein